MTEPGLHQRLSQINTLWSMVRQAHLSSAEATEAQERLMQRYSGAVYRYLLGAVRDPDVADDLAQEFALRFVRGDFRRADPERGRFRSLVKTAVINLVTDYRRRQKVRGRVGTCDDLEAVGAVEEPAQSDREFVQSWREELLTRAWEGLAKAQEQTSQPLYAALRLRADQPDLTSTQLAEQLAAQLGRPINAGAVRQLLHRARKVFTDSLLEDVLQSLDSPTPEQLEEELSDLELLEYCRHALGPGRGR